MQQTPADIPGLVQRAKANDTDAFTELYRLTVTPVYRYLSARIADSGEAEELTQEVYLAALQGLDRLRADDQSSLYAWLYQIARNKLTDHLRRRYRRPTVTLEGEAGQLEDGSTRPDDEAARQDEAREVREALDQLTPEQRDVVVYKYMLGYSNEQTARLVKRNTNAVNQLNHRALRSLQRILGGTTTE